MPAVEHTKSSQNRATGAQRLPIRAVIISYEPDPKSLEDLLESLQRQSYPIHIQIWDNGSRKMPLEELAKRFGVELRRTRRNFGFGDAIHRAMIAAPERLVLILNWDVRLEPNVVEELVRVYSSQPGIGAVCPKVLWAPDPRFIDSVGTGLDKNMQAFNRGIGEPDLGQYDVDESPLGACFSAVLLDRAAYLTIGGMDTRYFLYYEDIDYSIRLRRYGYQIRTAPRAVVYHEHSAGVSRFPDYFKHYYLKRNFVWTALKHLPAIRLMKFLPFVSGVAFTEGRLRKRFALNWLRILFSTLFNLPHLLYVRWSLPRERTWLYLMDESPETFFDAGGRQPIHPEWAEATARKKRFALTGHSDDWFAYRQAKARQTRWFYEATEQMAGARSS